MLDLAIYRTGILVLHLRMSLSLSMGLGLSSSSSSLLLDLLLVAVWMREVERGWGHGAWNSSPEAKGHRGRNAAEIRVCEGVRGRDTLGRVKLEELVEQIECLNRCENRDRSLNSEYRP